MDHILLCTNHIPPITTIYNSFIEDYMPAANGSYVKVYLYIAKCLQAKESNFSISSLALPPTEKPSPIPQPQKTAPRKAAHKGWSSKR